MKRFSNPQELAALNVQKGFTGDERLCSHLDVDPDTWLTPRFILEQLGAFDLDPCAATSRRDWVALRSFTKNEDGLAQEWRGRVFVNPPFSNTVPWVIRHADHAQGITLVAASIESEVWRSHVWPRARAILLLHGRTRFANPDGSMTRGRPLRSIALIAWGDDDARILQGSALAGVFLDSWHQR